MAVDVLVVVDDDGEEGEVVVETCAARRVHVNLSWRKLTLRAERERDSSRRQTDTNLLALKDPFVDIFLSCKKKGL